MSEDNIPYRQRLAMIRNGQAEKTTGAKKRKPIAKFSEKKLAEIKAQKENGGENTLDAWFEWQMANNKPVCEECGMEAYWLLEPQEDPKKAESYRLMWRASQAHILPKKKRFGFKSVSTHRENHMVLFPSWGGHLCGCHGFYDSTWYNASTMKVWGKAKRIFKETLYPLLPQEEHKNIPDELLSTLK